MWEQCTQLALRAVYFAQEENGLAAHVMIKRGIELESLRREVVALQNDEDQRSASEL
jgi:hypothetical protein